MAKIYFKTCHVIIILIQAEAFESINQRLADFGVNPKFSYLTIRTTFYLSPFLMKVIIYNNFSHRSKAHKMQILRKPKLLVFLAAGSSVNLGIPATTEVIADILQEIRNDLDDDRSQYLDTSSADLDLLTNHLTTCLGNNWNFENLLNALETLESLSTSWGSRTVPSFKTMDGIFSAPIPQLTRCYPFVFYSTAKEAFYRSLHRQFSRADASITIRPHWNSIRKFLTDLNKQFDLHVATTNYDTIIEKALGWDLSAEGFQRVTGSNPAVFNPAIKNIRLLHLHGNVKYSCANGMVSSTPLHISNLVRFDSSEEVEIHLINNFRSGDGHTMDVGPMITGARKATRFICEPYASYFETFSNWCRSIPNLLVIGYGFGDEHINNCFRHFTEQPRACKKILAIDYIPPENQDPFGAWVRNTRKQELAAMVHHWSGNDRPFHDKNLSEPLNYYAQGNQLSVHLNGLIYSIQNHQNDIFSFFKTSLMRDLFSRRLF